MNVLFFRCKSVFSLSLIHFLLFLIFSPFISIPGCEPQGESNPLSDYRSWCCHLSGDLFFLSFTNLANVARFLPFSRMGKWRWWFQPSLCISFQTSLGSIRRFRPSPEDGSQRPHSFYICQFGYRGKGNGRLFPACSSSLSFAKIMRTRF